MVCFLRLHLAYRSITGTKYAVRGIRPSLHILSRRDSHPYCCSGLMTSCFCVSPRDKKTRSRFFFRSFTFSFIFLSRPPLSTLSSPLVSECVCFGDEDVHLQRLMALQSLLKSLESNISSGTSPDFLAILSSLSIPQRKPVTIAGVRGGGVEGNGTPIVDGTAGKIQSNAGAAKFQTSPRLRTS